MAKVGVITLHRVFNYGSVLQAYATQKVIESIGHECEIIDYITPQRTKKVLRKRCKIKGLKGVIYYMLRLVSIEIKWYTFNKFIKKHIRLSKKRYVTIEDLRKDPPACDIYCTGSDQTWNSKYNEGIDHGFFLDFGDKKVRRIAYAASIGTEIVPSDEKQLMAELMSKYAVISVRESSAVEIVKELTGVTPQLLIDPTLQICASEWSKLEAKPLLEDKYVLLILLYNEDNGATDYARKVADKLGCKLVKISWDLIKDRRVDKMFTHRSPEVFLSLVHHAKYVVTNSFHGTAFCINYNKQFSVFKRNEMQTRIDSLLELTGLTSRLVKGNDMEEQDEVGKIIDYASVNEILKIEREKAVEFLCEALNGK